MRLNEIAGIAGQTRATVGNAVPTRGLRYLPALIAIGAAVGMFLYGPIPQLPHYHDFADRGTWLGIPNAADVLSNLGFAVVGLWGIARARGLHPFSRIHGVGRRPADDAFDPFSDIYEKRVTRTGERSFTAVGLFVVSLLLTALGSAFYHLAPDNERLIWDRLPIALACAGLLAAVRSESLGRDDRMTTTLVAIAAVLSVIWWRITEQMGSEDLRPYLLLQALPLVLIPIWQWLYGASRERRVAFAFAILLYVTAKVAELNDHAIYAALGGPSGHTIKHLLAAAASAVVVWGLTPCNPVTSNQYVHPSR